MPRHTRTNPYENVLTRFNLSGLDQAWAYATGNTISDSSPAVANGVVYIGSTSGSFYALDAATGAKQWSSVTGGRVYSSPAVANGMIYIGSEDGNVYAYGLTGLHAPNRPKRSALHPNYSLHLQR